MIKFVKIIAISAFLFFLFLNASLAGSEKATLYFFWGKGCPHCSKEKIFLEEIRKKYPNIAIRDFEVSKNSENRKILAEVGKKLNINISGVPFTVIGDKYFIGWQSSETTGKELEEAVKFFAQNDCKDVVSEVIESCIAQDDKGKIEKKISVPLFGEIDTKNYSLPVLAIILGAIDGFNPCAMWVLIFLVGLLLGMKDSKRRWILGSAFIISSAVVYFVFMSAWLNLLLFLGFIVWIRIIIGIVAVAGGVYNLKEYWQNREGVCKITKPARRKMIFEKIKKFAYSNSFWMALGGIIILAFAVNLVELVCSAGLPAVFTQILTLSNLSSWQQYGYISIYIFFFMLDDLFVFFAAMLTLQVTGITTKYTRLSHLIGGILMLILGLMLIFKPEWLMFG